MSNYKNISLELDNEFISNHPSQTEIVKGLLQLMRDDKNISICVSNGTVVAFKCDGRNYIVDEYQHYNRSTSKHLNEFFGMDSKERENAIGSGKIKVIPDSNLKHVLK